MISAAAYVSAVAWFALSFAAAALCTFIVWHGHGTTIKILATLLLCTYFVLALLEPPAAINVLLQGGSAELIPAVRSMVLALFYCLAAREVMLWLRQ